MDINAVRDELVAAVAGIEGVVAIGQTGDINEKLIPGFSDIDMFVLCDEVPSPEVRRAVYDTKRALFDDCRMRVCDGGLWGHGDILGAGGVPVMFMYFTLDEMSAYIDSVLSGENVGREGGFYPTGRLASIEGINVLYDADGAYAGLKARIAEDKAELCAELTARFGKCILDEEDLGRSLVRKDVLFYHMVLENALDSLLITLYAANGVLFPSRKRSEKYIAGFEKKPVDCYARLLDIVALGARGETIEQSVAGLRALTGEVLALCNG